MRRTSITIFLLLAACYSEFCACYSANRDASLVEEHNKQSGAHAAQGAPKLDHARIARRLVHQANWTSFGTISVDNTIKGYPMVNIISINDNNVAGKSTGHIQFLLTDLDYTGTDWHQDNKVTLLFTDEQVENCSKNKVDPMEPLCPRAIVSGRVVKMDKNSENYDNAVAAFVQRHPAATNWLKAHNFYLCELDIVNIFVLDFYGGPHTVSSTEYYNVENL